EQAGEHEDVSPRHREGVQDRALDDVEVVVERLRTERGDQTIPQRLHILVDRGILGQRQLRARLQEEVRAHLALAALPGGEHALPGEQDREERCQERMGPSHGRRRATSRAKYVITMSAPARRIASRLSSTTRSSSIQPRAAAALTIEYSPLT